MTLALWLGHPTVAVPGRAGAAPHDHPGLPVHPGRDRLRRGPGPGPAPAPGPGRPDPKKPAAGQPAPSRAAAVDIPAAYLTLYQRAVRRCPGLAWTVLAATGKVESNHGRARLPGVRSGWNHAGAAGPMQFGIGVGRAGNAWAGSSAAARPPPTAWGSRCRARPAAGHVAQRGAAGAL